MKVILLAFSVACLLFAGYSLKAVDYKDYQMQTVVVNNGDTLWEIASKFTGEKEDVREVMYRISRANDLNAKYVYPGQVLKVPLHPRNDSLMMAKK